MMAFLLFGVLALVVLIYTLLWICWAIPLSVTGNAGYILTRVLLGVAVGYLVLYIVIAPIFLLMFAFSQRFRAGGFGHRKLGAAILATISWILLGYATLQSFWIHWGGEIPLYLENITCYEGPDTWYAREHCADLFKMAEGATISQLYFQDRSPLLYSMTRTHFYTSSPGLVARMIEEDGRLEFRGRERYTLEEALERIRSSELPVSDDRHSQGWFRPIGPVLPCDHNPSDVEHERFLFEADTGGTRMHIYIDAKTGYVCRGRLGCAK